MPATSPAARYDLRLLAALIVGATVASLTGTGDAAAASTLRFGSHAPPQSWLVREGLVPLFRQMEADSAGALKIQAFWGGAIMKSPNKQFEAMINGVQDGTLVFPSYTQALFPEFTLFNQPFLFRGAEEGSIAAWKMHEAGLLRGLDQLKVVAIFSSASGGIHMAGRINGIDDVKGKKIGGGGPAEAAVIAELGGTPVGIGIAQTAEALSSGIIQGTHIGWSGVGSFKLIPLIKASIDLPFGQPIYFVAFSKRAYDALPEAARSAIDKNSGIEASRRLGAVMGQESDRVKGEFANQRDHRMIRLAGAQHDEVAARFQKFHTNWIAERENGRKVYDALQTILTEMRR